MADLLDNMDYPRIIKVRRVVDKPGIYVQFYYEPHPLMIDSVPPDDFFLSVVEWCKENKCGKRMSYDMFKLKNEQELMIFMLRWQ